MFKEGDKIRITKSSESRDGGFFYQEGEEGVVKADGTVWFPNQITWWCVSDDEMELINKSSIEIRERQITKDCKHEYILMLNNRCCKHCGKPK